MFSFNLKNLPKSERGRLQSKEEQIKKMEVRERKMKEMM